MTLIEIAKIYTDLVTADNAIPDSEHIAKDEINCLRSKYHEVLMNKLREEGIEFADRFEAMNLAFEIAKEGMPMRNEYDFLKSIKNPYIDRFR